MKTLESNPIERYPTYIDEIVTPYDISQAPFIDGCFNVDETDWRLANSQLTDGLDCADKYTRYTSGNEQNFIFKAAEECSVEPLSDPFASYIGNRWMGIPVARSAPMVSRMNSRRYYLGVVSYATSITTLAGWDSGIPQDGLTEIDTTYMQGDGVLRAWLRDHDHAWRHIVTWTGSDGVMHYYFIDYGRSCLDLRTQWNETKLLNDSVGGCFWDIEHDPDKIIEYVKCILRIPDWLINYKLMQYASSMQKYDVVNKEFYLRRAYEMSSYLIKSKRNLLHDVSNFLSAR